MFVATGIDDAGRDAAAMPAPDVLGASGVEAFDGNAVGDTSVSGAGVAEGVEEDGFPSSCGWSEGLAEADADNDL